MGCRMLGINDIHRIDNDEHAHATATAAGFTGECSDTTRITVQEAALLQTFPADYPWQGGLGQQFQQVGNAVPPLLAAHLIAELGVGQMPATHQLLATA
jgi:site-specific DNA-cytosine methylase